MQNAAATMSDTRFAQFQPSKFSSEYPDLLVIVGSGRSGTTMLFWWMGPIFNTPRYGEFQVINEISRRLPHYGDLNKPENLRQLASDLYNGAYGRSKKPPFTFDELMSYVRFPTLTDLIYAMILCRCLKANPTTQHLVYKFPADLRRMDSIAELLPTARFIHIVRDGRDVMQSLRKVKEWGQKTAYTGIRYWNDAVNTGRRLGKQLGPERYFEIRYEDFLAAPEAVMPQFVEYVLGHPDQEKADAFSDAIKRKRKLDRLTTWKKSLSANEHQICEAVAWETLREYGYETIYPSQPTIASYIRIGSLFKDVTIRTWRRLQRRFSS